MNIHRTLFFSMLAAILIVATVSTRANQANSDSALDCERPNSNSAGAGRPVCHAVAYVCGNAYGSGGALCDEGPGDTPTNYSDWDGEGQIGGSAAAASTLSWPPQFGKTVQGTASAFPGSVKAVAKTLIGVAESDGTSLEYFDNPASSIGTLFYMTLAFHGNAIVSSSLDYAQVSYWVRVYFNQIGQPRWPLTNDTCQVPSNNCIGYAFSGTITPTQYFTTEIEQTYGPTITNGPDYYPIAPGTRGVSFPQEAEVIVPAGYQPTIVTMAGATAEGNATADMSSTIHLYLNAVTGDDFVAESGHDYSDPARWPTVRVKSNLIPAGNHTVQGAVEADQGWKILSGGVRMGAGKFVIRTDPFSAPLLQAGYSGVAPIGGAFGGLGQTFWDASGRDDVVENLGGMTVFGIELRDGWADPTSLANDQQINAAHYEIEEVASTSFSSSDDNHTTAQAKIPTDFVMAGGGCRITDKSSNDALLTGSYPADDSTWVCAAEGSGPPGLTAIAIGIRPLLAAIPKPQVQITKTTSAREDKPSAIAPLAGPGFVISGCGGNATPGKHAQPLTGIFPIVSNDAATGCEATSLNHNQSGEETLTAYAVNLLLAYPALESIAPGHVTSPVMLTGTHFVDGMVLAIVSDSKVVNGNIIGAPDAVLPVSVNSSRQGAVTLPASVLPGAYVAYLAIPNINGSEQTVPFTVQ
jgi:hypothetical protein